MLPEARIRPSSGLCHRCRVAFLAAQHRQRCSNNRSRKGLKVCCNLQEGGCRKQSIPECKTHRAVVRLIQGLVPKTVVFEPRNRETAAFILRPILAEFSGGILNRWAHQKAVTHPIGFLEHVCRSARMRTHNSFRARSL